MNKDFLIHYNDNFLKYLLMLIKLKIIILCDLFKHIERGYRFNSNIDHTFHLLFSKQVFVFHKYFQGEKFKI